MIVSLSGNVKLQFVYPEVDALPRLLAKEVDGNIALMGECCCFICGISWMPQLIFPVPEGLLGEAVCPFNVHWNTRWYLAGKEIKPVDYCDCYFDMPTETMYYFLSALGWGLFDIYYLCDLAGLLQPDQEFFLRFNKYVGYPDPPVNGWFILSGVPYWDKDKNCYHIFYFDYDEIIPQPLDLPDTIAHKVRFDGDGVLTVREEAYTASGTLVGWGVYYYQKPELQELECGGEDTSSSQIINPDDSDSSSSSSSQDSSSSSSESSSSSFSESSESSSSSSSEESSSSSSEESSSSPEESSSSSEESSSSPEESSSSENTGPGWYYVEYAEWTNSDCSGAESPVVIGIIYYSSRPAEHGVCKNSGGAYSWKHWYHGPYDTCEEACDACGMPSFFFCM